MKHFSATVVINAPPRRVWRLLTAVGDWSDWHPTIAAIEGDMKRGGKLIARAKATPDKPFAVKVVALTPERRMVWKSGMPLGMLTEQREYVLEDLPQGRARLTLNQRYDGCLMAFVGGSIPDMNAPLTETTTAIKAKLEGAAPKRT